MPKGVVVDVEKLKRAVRELCERRGYDGVAFEIVEVSMEDCPWGCSHDEYLAWAVKGAKLIKPLKVIGFADEIDELARQLDTDRFTIYANGMVVAERPEEVSGRW